MLARLRSTYFYICWLPVAVYLLSEAASKKEPVWKLLTATLIGGSVFIGFLVRSLVLQLND
jgi:hypothetical protein